MIGIVHRGPLPLRDEDQRSLDLTGAQPNVLVVLMVSTLNHPFHAGTGAYVYIDPSTWSTLITGTSDAQGAWSFTMPLDPVFQQLAGLTIASQITYGPTTVPLGADATNGVQWTIGN